VPSSGGSHFLVARREVPGPRKSVLGFLSARALEIATRAARGERSPILSLPTAHGGAIARELLASRRRLVKPARFDAIQAGLRAGEVKPATTLRFEFESANAKHFELVVDPPRKYEPSLEDVPGLFIAALSTADYTGVGADGRTGLAEAVRWVGTVWPANREVFYAKGAAELGRNVDWWQAMWHVRCFLEPLLLPAEPIGEMGRLLLAVGLAAKEPGERALATDVLIRSVGQGRIDARSLVEILGRLYDHGEIKGSRIATTLAEAARVSSNHSDAVATVLERVLAGMHGSPPADLHALLTTLSDTLVAAARPLRDPDASAYLSGIEGSGKAAATARQVLRDSRVTGPAGER
jgi:Family of unknown function (DUF6493)